MKFSYAGVYGVTLAPESFDLGEGVVISQTFAHLFSPWMMAFAPPGPAGHHPTPWKSARGGRGIDITVEIRVPDSTSLGPTFTPKETAWWIAALLRLARFPYISVPVISDQPFGSITEGGPEPILIPFETEPRILAPAEGRPNVLANETLEWLRDVWVPAGRLLNSQPRFFSALKAFDGSTVRGNASSSLLALWGGLEQLFSPSSAELRFRISALLAAYHEPPGQPRHELFKRLMKLYGDRCTAAHTATETETRPLIETYVLMRNTLIKIIEQNHLPTQEQLELLLFGCHEDKRGR